VSMRKLFAVMGAVVLIVGSAGLTFGLWVRSEQRALEHELALVTRVPELWVSSNELLCELDALTENGPAPDDLDTEAARILGPRISKDLAAYLARHHVLRGKAAESAPGDPTPLSEIHSWELRSLLHIHLLEGRLHAQVSNVVEAIASYEKVLRLGAVCQAGGSPDQAEVALDCAERACGRLATLLAERDVPADAVARLGAALAALPAAKDIAARTVAGERARYLSFYRDFAARRSSLEATMYVLGWRRRHALLREAEAAARDLPPLARAQRFAALAKRADGSWNPLATDVPLRQTIQQLDAVARNAERLETEREALAKTVAERRLPPRR
jgi:hypothetical protein